MKYVSVRILYRATVLYGIYKFGQPQIFSAA